MKHNPLRPQADGIEGERAFTEETSTALRALQDALGVEVEATFYPAQARIVGFMSDIDDEGNQTFG